MGWVLFYYTHFIDQGDLGQEVWFRSLNLSMTEPQPELCLTPKRVLKLKTPGFSTYLCKTFPMFSLTHSFNDIIIMIYWHDMTSSIFVGHVFPFQRFLKMLGNAECWHPQYGQLLQAVLWTFSCFLITFLQVAVHPKHYIFPSVHTGSLCPLLSRLHHTQSQIPSLCWRLWRNRRR